MDSKKIDQCMKPHGREGIETIKRMNENHEEISEFAFKCIEVKKGSKIIDIGCGGGVNIEKFLKISENVDGLDYSEISVAESVKRNQKAVDVGKCRIMLADVCDMPIKDREYDLVTAFESIYFWQDIENTFKEVFRIIKENGRFVIAQGTDGNHPDDEKWLNTVEGMKVYKADELNEYLLNAGFKNMKIHKKKDDYILVVIAEK